MCQSLKWWWKKVTAPSLPENDSCHHYVGWVYAGYIDYVMSDFEDGRYFWRVRLHCDGRPAYGKLDSDGPFFCEGDDGKEYLLLAKWVLR